MSTPRETLICHLTEVLQLLENPDVDFQEIRPFFPYLWTFYGEDEFSYRLSRIESLLQKKLEQPLVSCALAEKEHADTFMHLLTGIEGRLKEERKHIFSWLSGAQHLICDPYFSRLAALAKHSKLSIAIQSFKRS